MMQRSLSHRALIALIPACLLAVCACDDGTHPNDRFSMDSSTLTGRLLAVDVSYGGGCAEHTFVACWEGAVQLSDPPQVTVALLHDGNGDGCEALISETLYIDLQALNDVSDTTRVAIAGGVMGQSVSHLYTATDDPYGPVDGPVLTIDPTCPPMRPLAQQ